MLVWGRRLPLTPRLETQRQVILQGAFSDHVVPISLEKGRMPINSFHVKDAMQPGDGTRELAGLPRGRRSKLLRAPRRGGVPTLTVVIASNGTRSGLEACLASVTAQCARFDAELIVVRAAPSAEIQVLGTLYPTARFVLASADATALELRSLGMAEATGDIVVFSEDGTVRENRWLATIMATVFPSDAEISASDQPFDWPAFFAASGGFTRKTLGIGER